MGEPIQWYSDKDDQPPFLKALAEARRMGWCYHHVQATVIAIDQYAEAATDNREFFCNRPHSIGGGRKNDDRR